MHAQIRQHIDVLGALTGEDERELALIGERRLVPEDPTAVLNLLTRRIGEQFRGVAELLRKVTGVRGTDRESGSVPRLRAGRRDVQKIWIGGPLGSPMRTPNSLGMRPFAASSPQAVSALSITSASESGVITARTMTDRWAWVRPSA